MTMWSTERPLGHVMRCVVREWCRRQRASYIVPGVEEGTVFWIDWWCQSSWIVIDGRVLPERFEGGWSVKHGTNDSFAD